MKKLNPTLGNDITFLTRVAILGALATVLMLFEFPLSFIAPPFYELDFSEIPVLIGTFAMGPIAGILIELIKILLNLAFNGTITYGIGELANFLMGCAFIIPAGMIYKYRKNRKFALIGMSAGTFSLVIVSFFLNVYVLLPTYATAMTGGDMSVFVDMGRAIFPAVDNVYMLGLLCVVPFNLIKGILISAITFLLYKRISPLLKMIRF